MGGAAKGALDRMTPRCSVENHSSNAGPENYMNWSINKGLNLPDLLIV